MVTTVARLLFDSIVPPQFRHDIPDGHPIGSKEVKDVLQRIAEQDPSKYREVSYRLMRLGSKGAVETGSSFSMNDLDSPIDKEKLMSEIGDKERAIFSNKGLEEKGKEDAFIKLYGDQSEKMPDMIFNASMGRGSNLAKMVASGARGNKSNLNSNLGADFLVLDSNDEPVPVGIKSSYAEGLSPAEYFAASYGTRSGLVSTKFSTQNSGFLSKQLNASTMDLMVTKHDCGTHNGIPVEVDDKDNVGSVLSRDTAGHPAGTILTPKILNDIKKAGKSRIVVRSTMTCEAPGGACSKCAGVRERGGLPALGEAIGLAASSALGEPLSQSLLSKKHTGGVANATKVTGFKAINALFQVPDTFPDKATLAQHDGVVDHIEKLPQGGSSVVVGGKEHYVSHDHEILVKKGDKLEAGDRLSTGTLNPAEIVKYKGVGAGRLNLMKQIQDTFKEAGIDVSRRNAEVVVRDVVDHVKVNDADETNSYLPDEIVEYGTFSHNYQPHHESFRTHPSKALNHYLEAPALHYSIGTRITPSVAKNLDEMGEKDVLVSKHEPTFEPTMVRLMENPSHDKDWMAQMGTSYVQKNLRKNVIGGNVSSDVHGTNPIPALAYAKEFGQPPKGVVGY